MKTYLDGASLLYLDSPAGKMDAVNDDNSGFVNRWTHAENSSSIFMLFKMHSDLFNQKRLILPNLPISITLQNSKNEFHVMSGTTGQVGNFKSENW